MLAVRLHGEPLFPIKIPLRAPGVAGIGAQFGAMRDWIVHLPHAGSNAVRGSGYDLQTRDINHRQLGCQQIPLSANFASGEDALRLIGRLTDARRFGKLASMTLVAYPELSASTSSRPLTLLDQADGWDRILAILQWFRAHPRPGLYLRQLDIPGVDTKFIEARKALLAECSIRCCHRTAWTRLPSARTSSSSATGC